MRAGMKIMEEMRCHYYLCVHNIYISFLSTKPSTTASSCLNEDFRDFYLPHDFQQRNYSSIKI